MVGVQDFFRFSNPLFLDSFVACVLYIVYRLAAKKFPRISQGIKEASLLFIVFMFYDASRYFALNEEHTATSNAAKVIEFERKVHIDVEIPMQKFVISHLDFAKFLNQFYLGAHWGGLVIFFVWAYARVIFGSPSKMERRRKEYVTCRGRFIIMNILAACSFMAYPCAPPRLMKKYGFIDTMAVISKTDVYSGTRNWVNPYAAMPSMHQGYSLLFAVTIVIMLRSEILATAIEPTEEEEESDDVNGKLASDPTGIRATLGQLMRRYNQYHILSSSTRQNNKKLFLLSLLPFAFLLYPAFMFLVIVGTGNHFVLDALAGASAMFLSTLIYPLLVRVVTWVEVIVLHKANITLSQLSARILGEKLGNVGGEDEKMDVEMGYVKDKEGLEEKKGFLLGSTAETA